MQFLLSTEITLSPGNPVFLLIIFAIVVCVFLLLLAGLKIGVKFGRKQERAEWESGKVQKAVQSSLKRSRAVLGGLVSEQLAPLLPGFSFDPGDCRFVGKPVDFIVFRGMNSKNIDEVIFLEVKSGKNPALNDQEKRLRDVIRAGRVRWAEYYVN
ncbi:MAG: hypothetical protein FWF22_02455 [Treponema sp.]|nr:hypothetical protein [Treponema sp.]